MGLQPDAHQTIHRDIGRFGLRLKEALISPQEFPGAFIQEFDGAIRAIAHADFPGVHFDEPYDDITALVYLTPGLPADCGTSLWRHKSTALSTAPSSKDAHRLNKSLATLRHLLERDATNGSKWIELDRAGYKYNRLVA